MVEKDVLSPGATCVRVQDTLQALAHVSIHLGPYCFTQFHCFYALTGLLMIPCVLAGYLLPRLARGSAGEVKQVMLGNVEESPAP